MRKRKPIARTRKLALSYLKHNLSVIKYTRRERTLKKYNQMQEIEVKIKILQQSIKEKGVYL